MLQRHASLLIATALVAMVATACIIRTRRPPAQRSQPVYVEKHKKQKPQKHKKHEDHGKHKGRD